MRPFFDSDIVVNFTLSEEAIQNEKKIIESNRRVLRECQKEKLINETKKNWDKFYHHYKTNFFKDRKWIRIEFDHIFRGETSINEEQTGDAIQDGGEGATQVGSSKEKKLVLEIGCGVGNTLIPLLMQYEHLNCIGIDFSKNAINLLNEKWNRVISLNEQLKDAAGEEADHGVGNEVGEMENVQTNALEVTENEENSQEEDASSDIFELRRYKKMGNLIKTCVVDITSPEVSSTEVCDVGTVDIVLLIYVLSSVQPEKMKNVIYHAYRYLKRGGYVLLRDYGLYDLAQVRFANKKEKKMSENFYVRGDKTFVYFFKTEELRTLFCENGFFEEVQNGYITRIVKNRKRNLEMKRIWVQSIFRKC
ncbi:methyltransferase, putative [Plasmodium knowlesi strain H]|uniref:tRNA N(3)-methylcytidine methyltransferase n=3 Tax=Plasmodium knowlesi TaxID=5850 RepID=A0A5K1V1X5_PLAKH|nr:methyltransferase, putative [Plasmodium knowlesi strain H]OTN64119.1 putative Methyltranserase [Plasmodium knowlesi]CAA9991275.1 methyltransferase, putative [Plasmodium knowlesi strain H]SBO26365.1 methyltransferase, putative [Plasmodium knowlesi strain H]SBO29018.1 methyltransferase, putative [Plasmodium knowlesi strain H]VVS80749.1 methyltransferase, putative [Plasmodium knowlesi strain H]|eukprot:XP_002262553.1 methyltranserase, putative [Plasmodium knowlesi strain H]